MSHSNIVCVSVCVVMRCVENLYLGCGVLVCADEMLLETMVVVVGLWLCLVGLVCAGALSNTA